MSKDTGQKEENCSKDEGQENQLSVNRIVQAFDRVELGASSGGDYLNDPKHLLFSLSRYKFVSKMLTGLDNVLEIGCGDGFGTALVSAVVKRLTAVDLDNRQIEQNIETNPYANRIEFITHDILRGSVDGEFDAVFSLDVLEHIENEYEFRFMANLTASLKSDGVCMIGMPSLQSQAYASRLSKLGHVNCKTGDELKDLMEKLFRRVFIFSMNDEVLHTGFHPMSHYLIALCVSPIDSFKSITVDP